MNPKLEKTFYVIGWITGALNLLFWFIQVILYFQNNKEEPFINKDFHNRVTGWGIFTSIIIILGFLISFFI